MLFNSNSNKLLFAALFLALCTAAVPKSFAASASQTYTVTIPAQTNVVLAGSATNFGTISPSEFGNGTWKNILLGDGTDSATSYVQSNDPTAGAKQYTITAAPGTGATAATWNGGNALTLANGTAASVSIYLGPSSSFAIYPKLGSTSGTPVAFVNTGGETLNIPVSSNVPFLASDGKAPLDAKLYLSMNQVTIADAAGSMSFSLTLTAVGL
jgi:hypothetical protein